MGPVRGVVSADTHNSQISGHHDYLAKMHRKALIGTGSPFVLQYSTDWSVRLCVYLNLRLFSKTLSFFGHISHSELFVFCVLCSEGFLAASLHLTFLYQRWQCLQGFNSMLLSASLCPELRITAGRDRKYC